MRDVTADINRWIESGDTDIRIATVLKTYGSAPRGVGGKMAVGSRGGISGSISGGCVESSIIEEARAMPADGAPEVMHFETSDDNAWDVGLPCGGTIDVLLEPLMLDHYSLLEKRIGANERAYSVTILGGRGPTTGGKISFGVDGASIGTTGGGAELDDRLKELAKRAERSTRIETDDGLDLFVEVFPPAPTLVLVGGVHIAIALVRLARILEYQTVVVDPRKTFGSAERFPDVDRLIGRWPEEAFEQIALTPETAVVVLTHDPKLDDPALVSALRSDAFYIGALGSNRTQARRKQRLLDAGFSERELSRIHGPVGLDIGAATPEEIALSIATEIVALSRRAGSVLRMIDFALGAGR